MCGIALREAESLKGSSAGSLCLCVLTSALPPPLATPCLPLPKQQMGTHQAIQKEKRKLEPMKQKGLENEGVYLLSAS